MRLTKLWTVFSLLLTSCATVKRPDLDVCIVNAGAFNRKCYNLHDDYSDDGHLKPNATPEYKDNKDISDLNKAMLVDSKDGFEEGISRLKAYIQKLRDSAQGCTNERPN